MEWLWFDPDRGEPTKWWTIDPQTGRPDDQAASDPTHRDCLGESALDAVGMVADAIATEFVTRGFSDGEVTALLAEQVVPVGFQGAPNDAADLVQSVVDLWQLATECYQEALGRLPNRIERQWLEVFALEAIRARGR